jgi:hypothetical protein
LKVKPFLITAEDVERYNLDQSDTGRWGVYTQNGVLYIRDTEEESDVIPTRMED